MPRSKPRLDPAARIPSPAGQAAASGPLARSFRHDQDARRALARRAFLAPLTIVLLALTVAPFVYNLAISLTDKASTSRHTKFIGLDNFGSLFSDSQFWSSIRITAIFTVVAVAIELALAMAMAVALSRVRAGTTLLRALFLLPLAAAPVASLFNWRMLLNMSYGVVNYLLGEIGLPQPNWTGRPVDALATLIMVDVWQWTPFVMIILAGGLASVPTDIYESSAVDGAGGWDTFRYITLPMLRPYIAVAVLFRSIDALKTFDSVQILTSGGPGTATTMLNYYIFREGISYLNFGRAAAAATVLLVVAILLARTLLGALKSRTGDA
jgi:multiple sugar transport system permease protein